MYSNGVVVSDNTSPHNEGGQSEGPEMRVDVLQTALDGAREELEEQRRLNQALIQRRVRIYSYSGVATCSRIECMHGQLVAPAVYCMHNMLQKVHTIVYSYN